MTTSTIQFIASHQPALKDGDYAITVEQSIQQQGRDLSGPYTLKKDFTVAGHRFHLDPQDVYAVFPPDHSLGEHSNVLPHIVLNRSTLPWERTVQASDELTPWLMLLVVHEDEASQVDDSIVSLSDLKASSSSSPYFPGLTLETSQHETDKVRVIHVAKGLLAELMPTKTQLQWLTHVRQRDKDRERAVLIAKRFPEKGKSSSVYLVSLENRFSGDNFNYQGAKDSDKIRLVTLKSWSFSCESHAHNFSSLLKNLNRTPETLRLPSVDNAAADAHLKTGAIPLPHSMRQGQRSVSWYHGPLTTGDNGDSFALPIRSSDELLRYSSENGLFDVSYAAAWELGRLMGLHNKAFSTRFYQWKRQHQQELRRAEQVIGHEAAHLPGSPSAGVAGLGLPPLVEQFFDDLRLIKSLPFHYLVSDEKLLPVESLRFFRVDPQWIECLVDGAFSIGRVTKADHAADEKKRGQLKATPAKVSGILLRSEVVSGWPGLEIDGWKSLPPSDNREAVIADSEKLTVLRMDRLSANVLIVLFAGELKTLDIHLKPEDLHFGVSFDADKQRTFKELRDSDGVEHSENKVTVSMDAKRVFDMEAMDTAIRAISDQSKIAWHHPPTSTDFALQMIEGVQKVRFLQKG